MSGPALVLVLLGALLAGSCAPAAADPIIDTWPVGEAVDCAQPPSCDELTRVGLAGLTTRDPGHAPVLEARLHREGAFVDPTTGETILTVRSGGCCHVLVVRLTDGSTRAIGVGFVGVSDRPIAIPWEETLLRR